MTKALARRIGDADGYTLMATEIAEAITQLSERYPTAIHHLIDAYAQNRMDAEIEWREIEEQEEYREHYKTRDEARADFLKANY